MVDQIERFISVEENGPSGAKRKARRLRDEFGYRIIRIEHTSVPMAGSTSTPCSSTWGKSEPGYLITAELCANSKDTPIPEIQ